MNILDYATSVYPWVEELKKQKQNPVLFFKAQSQHYPKLFNKDFAVGIQTSL